MNRCKNCGKALRNFNKSSICNTCSNKYIKKEHPNIIGFHLPKGFPKKDYYKLYQKSLGELRKHHMKEFFEILSKMIKLELKEKR